MADFFFALRFLFIVSVALLVKRLGFALNPTLRKEEVKTCGTVFLFVSFVKGCKQLSRTMTDEKRIKRIRALYPKLTDEQSIQVAEILADVNDLIADYVARG